MTVIKEEHNNNLTPGYFQKLIEDEAELAHMVVFGKGKLGQSPGNTVNDIVKMAKAPWKKLLETGL